MAQISVTMVNQTVPFPALVVRLPTYALVAQDPPNMRAIVTVPDEDFPATTLTPGDDGFDWIGDDYTLTEQTAPELAAWKSMLSTRYGWPLARLNVSVVPWLADN